MATLKRSFPVALIRRRKLDQLVRDRDAAVRAESDLISELDNVRAELASAHEQYQRVVTVPDRIRARQHQEPARILAASDVPPARMLDIEPSTSDS